MSADKNGRLADDLEEEAAILDKEHIARAASLMRHAAAALKSIQTAGGQRTDAIDVQLADKLDEEAAKLRAMKEDRGDAEYWLLKLFLDNLGSITSSLRTPRAIPSAGAQRMASGPEPRCGTGEACLDQEQCYEAGECLRPHLSGQVPTERERQK